MQGDLDQLWYTWSHNGLDAMAMGYRVRAASGELRNTQGMRYRVLDRFLRYDSPQNMNSNELDARTAPISYAYLNNGPEFLLIRKVFKGRDSAGRNSVYFTHLIAGLPEEMNRFNARDAIRLWNSPLWVESEEGKAANDTQLDQLSSADLKRAADQAPPPVLPFAAIRAQLEDLLLAILCQNGLSVEVYLTGHSSLAAALIYGLTHCLPLSLLHNFTFSTYESTAGEIDATILTTITGAKLTDSTTLDVRAVGLPPASAAGIQKYRAYVTFAVNALINGPQMDFSRFFAFLKEMEERNCQHADQLMQEFNLEYSQGPLTFEQIETIVMHPAKYIQRLHDAGFQQQSAAVLLDPGRISYWQKRGQKTFQTAVAQLTAPAGNMSEVARQALSAYLNGLAPYILNALADGLRQVKMLEAQGQDPWPIPQHCGNLLITLLPPAYNEQIWVDAIQRFSQEPQLFAYLKSASLWPFQCWMLEQAGKLPQPQRFLAQVRPWLDIPSWEKLSEVLALQLPAEWSYTAIYGCLQDVPRGAVALIQKYEQIFFAALRFQLQQGGQNALNLAVSFFQKMVEYGYPHRGQLLLTLVNTYAEAGFVQTIFASVDLATPARLTPPEIRTVLSGCSTEVIATCNRSQALASYLQEFLLGLTPARLNAGNTFQLLTQLKQLSAGPGLPPLFAPEIADLVNHWLMVNAFLNSPTLDRHLLTKTKTAIEHIFRCTHPASSRTVVQTFADEFIPVLAQKVHSEFDLEMILDILDKTMTGSRWNLLLWMALLTGQRQPKTQLYELFPYVICGIREAERSGQTDHDLADCLQRLSLDQEMLKSIDTIVNEKIWPDMYRRRWETWRKRDRRKLDLKRIPLPGLPTRGNTGRLPVQQQAIVLPGLDKQARPAVNAQPQVLYAQEAARSVHGAPTWQDNIPVQQLPQMVATLQTPNRSISYEAYLPIHGVMADLLFYYWLPTKNMMEQKENAKSLNFEIETLRKIYNDLHQHPEFISLNLVAYLVDDVLIEETIVQNNITQSIDPTRYQDNEFKNLPAALRVDSSQELSYKQALFLLIRRYMVIIYIEDPNSNAKEIFGKGDLRAFLHRKRKKAKISIPGDE